MRSEGFYAMTLAGIEAATFRFVAQPLTHCATAAPPPPSVTSNNLIIFMYWYFVSAGGIILNSC